MMLAEQLIPILYEHLRHVKQLREVPKPKSDDSNRQWVVRAAVGQGSPQNDWVLLCYS